MDIRRIAGDYADACNRVGRDLAVAAVAKRHCIPPAHVTQAVEEWSSIAKSHKKPPAAPPIDSAERFAKAMAEAKDATQ